MRMGFNQFKKQGVIIFCGMVLIATGYGCFALQPEQPTFPRASTPTASHYLPSVLYQGQRLRWDFYTHTHLTVCMNVPENPTDIDRQLQPLAIEAIQQWLAVLPEAQKTTLQFEFPHTPACENSKLLLSFVPSLDAHYTAGKTTETKDKVGFTAAITTPVFSPTTGKLTAMTMTVALNKPTGLPQSNVLLKSVLLHEVGHAMGLLGHSPNPNDVMATAYYNRAGSQAKLALSASDVATLQALYGQPGQWSNTINGAILKANQLLTTKEARLPLLRHEAETVGLALQWRNLGATLLWLGQQKEALTQSKRTVYLEEAIQAFNHVLKLQPQFSAVAIQLSQAYQLLKQLDEAQAVLSTALLANPLCSNCYLEQAWISAKLKQWNKVKQALYNAKQVNARVVDQPAYQKIEHLLLLASLP
jgi:Matrixin/Tetratricopeptide repeat